MQDHVGLINHAFLHWLTIHTNALTLVFVLSSVCKMCGEEFVNRLKRQNNNVSKEG